MTESAVRADASPVRSSPRRLAAVLCLQLALVALAIPFVIGRFGDGYWAVLSSPWAFQCWIGAIVVLLVALMIEASRTALAAGALALWSSIVVVPQLLSVETSARVLAGGTEVPTFRVIEANVRFRGAPPAEAIEWLREADADFVGLVEFNSAWADAMESLGDLYPYSSGTIDDRTSGGTALFSKYPLVEARTTLAPTGIRTIVEAIARRPEGYVRILVVHPLSPTTPERAAARDEELAWIAERCATSDLPVIVMGDFNETPFGDAYRTFVDRSGLRSAHEGFGHIATWPARVHGRPLPNVLRIAIDHCFVSKHFSTRDMSVGPDIMSDHRPIVIDLAWSPAVR